jgi:AraC-like DNA-binding protein
MATATPPRRPQRTRASETPAPAAPDADFRAAVLRPAFPLLAERGVDPAAILAATGLDPARFADPDLRIPYATGGALLARCAAATRMPHFGLLVGARFDLAMLGVLGQLIGNSPTVGDALQQLVRHLHLHDRGAVAFTLDLGRAQTALGYAVYRSDTPGIAEVYDLALSVGASIVRALCGGSWRPDLVTLAHRAPADTAPYRRHFGAPVQFDAPHSELVFPSRWLDGRVSDATLPARVAAERVAKAQERRERLGERVHRIVRGLLVSGDLSSPRVAAIVGMHERVLRRRLHEEGTSLVAIVDRARLEGARALLDETELPLPDIAAALAYSDATAFSRAFRRWTGTTPNAWRSRGTGASVATPAAPRRPTRPGSG